MGYQRRVHGTIIKKNCKEKIGIFKNPEYFFYSENQLVLYKFSKIKINIQSWIIWNKGLENFFTTYPYLELLYNFGRPNFYPLFPVKMITFFTGNFLFKLKEIEIDFLYGSVKFFLRKQVSFNGDFMKKMFLKFYDKIKNGKYNSRIDFTLTEIKKGIIFNHIS